MDARPEPPPEGVLIASALKDARISVREASRRAGISDGWWRQIVNGYQNLSGGASGAVRAPAETLARMALVAGVTPEQLRTNGQRPDAAAELEKIRRGPDTAPREARRVPSASRADDPAVYVFPDDPAAQAAFREAFASHPVVAAIWAPDRPPEAKAAEIRGWLTGRAKAEAEDAEARRAAGLSLSSPAARALRET